MPPPVISAASSGFAGFDHGRGDIIFDPAARRPALDHLAAFEVGRDADLDKTGFAQPSFNSLGRSRTSDAAAEECRIGSQLGRQWRDVDDIRDGEPAARLEHPKRLTKYLLL